MRAILIDPDHEFNVRAITRDVNTDKAKAIAKFGAEVLPAKKLQILERALLLTDS